MGIAAIVGGGFSGVVTARELVRAGWSVVLVDREARPGRGVAYSTADPSHLLNSPVGTMSVDPDRPDDFLEWCHERDSRISASDFVPRSWYGDYLTAALRAADIDAPGRLTIHRGHVQRIFDAESGGVTVLLGDDIVIAADVAVLAVGSAPPGEPVRLDASVRRCPAYVPDPWRPGALDGVADGPVLLIGTGLTAVDVTLSLHRTGRRGPITAVSRHGLLPVAHERSQRQHVEPPQTQSVATLTRWVREQARATGDWRGVMDGLRPYWDVLWQRLPASEQARFLRHVARYWEVHRHRMAPQVARAIERLRADGSLSIRAAEVCGLEVAPAGGIGAVVRTPQVERHTFAAVINCSGPGRLTQTHPLVRSLIADGLAAVGPHGLGLAAGDDGALIRRDQRSSRIYAVGPARRGELWETTAAPEIRGQARALALRLDGYAYACAASGV